MKKSRTLLASLAFLLSTVTFITCSPEILTIPSFGQKVQLGALLDAHSFTFLPGASVFEKNFKIPRVAIDRTPRLQTMLRFQEIRSTEHRLRGDFRESLILSILSDQIDTEGSFRYLVEEPAGESIRYRSVLKRKLYLQSKETLKIEEMFSESGASFITIPHAIAHNFTLEELMSKENENATHFVLGITYGKHIAGVLEDRLVKRKYGLTDDENEMDMEDWEEDLEEIHESREGAPGENVVARIYSDFPLPAPEEEGRPLSNKQLVEHFANFAISSKDTDVVPLYYDLMPLSAIAGFLGPNATMKAKLIKKWGPENYIGDPNIDSWKMTPVYREFDRISIAQFRMRELMHILTNSDATGQFATLIPNRQGKLENITTLHSKFENSFEDFKRNMSDILTLFRFNKMRNFDQALENVLRNYKSDEYSPRNVQKKLFSEFKTVIPVANHHSRVFQTAMTRLQAYLEQLLVW